MLPLEFLHSHSKKPDKDKQFDLFAGHSNSCSKKALEHTNYCTINPKGSGRQLGAKCTPGEKELSEKHQNNLYVYVGKKSHKQAGVTVIFHCGVWSNHFKSAVLFSWCLWCACPWFILALTRSEWYFELNNRLAVKREILACRLCTKGFVIKLIK